MFINVVLTPVRKNDYCEVSELAVIQLMTCGKVGAMNRTNERKAKYIPMELSEFSNTFTCNMGSHEDPKRYELAKSKIGFEETIV